MINEEPRYAVAAIYSQTATLYDYMKKREIKSVDASYADESDVRELFAECAILNAKHEDDLLYLKNINEL